MTSDRDLLGGSVVLSEVRNDSLTGWWLLFSSLESRIIIIYKKKVGF